MALPNLMSVPGASADLGLGLGDMLRDQTLRETEEERKKRMLQKQQQGMSPAAQSLFGGMLGPGT